MEISDIKGYFSGQKCVQQAEGDLGGKDQDSSMAGRDVEDGSVKKNRLSQRTLSNLAPAVEPDLPRRSHGPRKGLQFLSYITFRYLK